MVLAAGRVENKRKFCLSVFGLEFSFPKKSLLKIKIKKLFFFSTRPAANTTSYLYILEYTGVLMVFHRLGKPSALWTSVGHV